MMPSSSSELAPEGKKAFDRCSEVIYHILKDGDLSHIFVAVKYFQK